MFWGSVLVGAVAALCGLLLNVALLTLFRGCSRTLFALRFANMVAAGLAFSLPVYYLGDYLGHAKLSVVSREGLRPALDRKCYTLCEWRTVYHVIAPKLREADHGLTTVVLLHGNNGTGAEIIGDTQWDRLARRKGWVLIAPTSPAHTWSTDADRVIIASLNDVAKSVPIDRSRILLTGRSDGATWCYNVGLRYREVFRAIAPVAGTFWPLARLHVHRSREVAVYIYHSVRDSIFPVATTRKAAAILRRAGHEVVYCEDEEGGHEYTPQQAERIAEWFEELAPHCTTRRVPISSPQPDARRDQDLSPLRQVLH